MIGPIMLLEVLIIIVIGIRHVIKLHKIRQEGKLLQQPEFERIGRILAFVSSIALIIIPRILDIKNKHDDQSLLVYVVIATVGFIVLFIGIKFRIYAYENLKDTPKWAKKIINIFYQD